MHVLLQRGVAYYCFFLSGMYVYEYPSKMHLFRTELGEHLRGTSVDSVSFGPLQLSGYRRRWICRIVFIYLYQLICKGDAARFHHNDYRI